MITIEIGSGRRETNDPGDVDKTWVHDQIHRRKAAGQRVCVQVTIHCDSVNVILATADCGGAGGGGRPPNSQEERVFDLWNRSGMGQAEFGPNNLIDFLKKLPNLVKA